ncbi:MAG TPA: FAD-binding oxidoreductase, partial [Phycicoccus sp.]
VRAVELVTADGVLRRVSAEADPELFWAVRGGGGAFGVVTALEVGLVPLPEFAGGTLVFGPTAVEPVLRAFARWAPTLPEEAATSIALLRLPAAPDVPPPMRGVVTLALRFAHAGPAARAEELLRPMRRVAAPVLDFFGPMSFAAVDGIHMDPTEPMPSVARGSLLHSVHDGPVDALLAVAGPEVEAPLAMVEVRVMGGALGRPAAVPNAVAGRDGAFSLVAVAPAPPPLSDAADAVTRGVLDALGPWSLDTSLLNFAGPERPAHRIWEASTLDRLRRLKAALDPEHRFAGFAGTGGPR